jgi:uncharacterized phage protein (TIGR02220 family)
MYRGYIALWRKIEDHPFYKEPRVFSKYEAWIDILKEAQHSDEPQEVILGMNVLICNYGECLKSNVTWAKKWNWSEPKVRRFLKLLEKMKQIRRANEGITTRITVINYECYDPKRRASDEQATRPRRDRDETATTDNNVKNVKNENIVSGELPDDEESQTQKETIPYKTIVEYLNKKANRDFKHSRQATKRLIKARFNEGFTEDDFLDVIDLKCEQWGRDDKMLAYLRPETLFGNKFESYLNEIPTG